MTQTESISVWRIATDTPHYTADNFTGEGARITGGRWNRQGNAVIYTADSVSLACLESLAHLDFGSLPLNRYLVRIDIPKTVWEQRFLFKREINVGWDALPAGRVSMNAGDEWITQCHTALMEVPSVIVPEETNILINPEHHDCRLLKVLKIRKWQFDVRVTAL